MTITIEYFENIVKSPHFLHLTSINWLVLKITALEISHGKWQLPQQNSIAAAKNCRSQFKIYFQMLFYSF